MEKAENKMPFYRKKRLGSLALFLGWLLFFLWLLPFLSVATGAYPAADDFVYVTRPRASWEAMRSIPHVVASALSYARQIYMNWQGTYTGALVMALNPLVFGVEGYYIHVYVLIALYLLALFFCLHALLRKGLSLPLGLVTGIFFISAILRFSFMPSLSEGLYWYNSAWFYTFAQAVLLFLIGLTPMVLRAHGPRRIAGTVALCLFSLFLGLNNYVTAALAFFLCCCANLCSLLMGRRRALKVLFPMLAVLLAALLFNVLAPGNAVRMASDGFHGGEGSGLLAGLFNSLLAAAQLGVRFVFRTPILLCCLPLLPVFIKYLPGDGRFSFKRPWLAPLLAFAGLWAIVFPHMYTSGNAGSARVINLYHGYTVLAMQGVTLYVAGALKGRTFFKKPRGQRYGLLALALCCLLSIFALDSAHFSYKDLISDQTGGTLSAYKQQTDALFETLQSAPEGSDVTVPTQTAWPRSVGTGILTADPLDWKNEATASYFHLHSARALPGATAGWTQPESPAEE